MNSPLNGPGTSFALHISDRLIFPAEPNSLEDKVRKQRGSNAKKSFRKIMDKH
jgi:hypothetical protein